MDLNKNNAQFDYLSDLHFFAENAKKNINEINISEKSAFVIQINFIKSILLNYNPQKIYLDFLIKYAIDGPITISKYFNDIHEIFKKTALQILDEKGFSEEILLDTINHNGEYRCVMWVNSQDYSLGVTLHFIELKEIINYIKFNGIK